MSGYTALGLSDFLPSDGFTIFVEHEMPIGDMEAVSDEVDEWIALSNLKSPDDYVWFGTCTILTSKDGVKLYKVLHHGIQFRNKEIETAFRLRFSCK